MIQKLWWYFSRPSYYGELIRMGMGSFSGFFCAKKMQKNTVNAQNWCKENLLARTEFFEEIKKQLIVNIKSDPLSKIHPLELSEAERRVEQSGAKLGGGSSVDLLFSLSESISARNIVETGVAYGWSSLAFLLSLEKRPSGRLWSIDKPYPGSGTEQFIGCAVPKRLHTQWNLLKGTDRFFLPQALHEAGMIDFCHYDSDKSYSGRMWAYPKLWEALRKEGIFISDDVGDNLAFKDFCERIDKKPLIVEEGERRFLGVLVK